MNQNRTRKKVIVNRMFESIQKVSNSLINYFCSSNSFDWMFYQKKKKRKRERPRRNENGNRSNYLYRNGLKNGSYFLLYCRKTVIILLLLEWSAVSYATLWWFIDLSWLICCFSHSFSLQYPPISKMLTQIIRCHVMVEYLRGGACVRAVRVDEINISVHHIEWRMANRPICIAMPT